MPKPTEAELFARVAERLRRDHPDPRMRAELYEDDRLARYVASITKDIRDDAMIARVIAGVRDAEDGEPG